MIKLRNLLIAAIAIVGLSTSASAGTFGVGVSGTFANINAEGTETEGTETDASPVTANATNTAWIGSIFAEYTMDALGGMTLGIDYIPGTADVNSRDISRTDTETSQEATTTSHTTASVKRTAQAEVENHITYYAEIPVTAGIYAKGGIVTMDVNTTENIGTTKTYGNTDVDGILFGLGYKTSGSGALYYKLEATHTAFDSLSLSEQGQSAQSPANKITADLDVTKATFAIGYAF
jgi:hypothetical protein